jgi:prophage antirepressor-like protein
MVDTSVMDTESVMHLVPYVSDAGHEVRVATIDGQPWLSLLDLCRILGITNITRAAGRLDEDEVAEGKIESPAHGKKTAWVVNEPGFYHLVLTSRSPAADALRRWLTHEVLPAIRARGAYLSEATTRWMVSDIVRYRTLAMTHNDAKLGAWLRGWVNNSIFVPYRILDPGQVEATGIPGCLDLAAEIRARQAVTA